MMGQKYSVSGNDSVDEIIGVLIKCYYFPLCFFSWTDAYKENFSQLLMQ